MTPNLEQIVTALGLFGARVSAVMLFAPFFGSMTMPARVKAGLVVAIVGLLYPVCRPHVLALPAGISEWALVGASEFVVGAVLALALNFIFEGAQLAGQILGLQMGLSIVNVLDPQTQVDSPVLSIFHQTIAMLIFLQLDVHHWLLRGLAKSFEYMPVGSLGNPAAITSELWRAAGGIWLIGVQIAAPALVATMLADVVLGFLGKASPQFPILFVGISAKSILGLLVTITTLAFWPTFLERHFATAIVLGERTLRLAR
ncbi:MAG TPA: flagellar biosynthetic protein FliR [Terriglobales bacterium]|nr:flagellar biosynthetic protein FliR [Terriglobales bacterium]